ncbi:MAG: small basic family protein [Clostridia bacterium]|nr:small basic family protein [Clostridia bacterium]
MLFVIAGILGVICGLYIPYNLGNGSLPYVAIAILAAMDSIFGALLAYFNKRFNMSTFMIGLFSNAILAVVLAYIGNLLGLSLYFAVIIVFGVRIFNNMAAIRRLTLDKYFEKKAKEKERIERLALVEASDDEKQTEDAECDKKTDSSDAGEGVKTQAGNE